MTTEGKPFFEVVGNESVNSFYEKNGYVVWKANEAFRKKWKLIEQTELEPGQTFDQLVQVLFSPGNSEAMLKAEGIEYHTLDPGLKRGRRFIPNAATVNKYKPFNELIGEGIDEVIRDLAVKEPSPKDGNECSYTIKRTPKTQLIISDVGAKNQDAHCDADDQQRRMFWIMNTVGNYSLDVWPESHTILRKIWNMPKGKTFVPGDYPVIARKQLLMKELSVAFISGGLLHRGPKNDCDKLHVRSFGELQLLSSQGECVQSTPTTKEKTHKLLKQFRCLFADA